MFGPVKDALSARRFSTATKRWLAAQTKTFIFPQYRKARGSMDQVY